MLSVRTPGEASAWVLVYAPTKWAQAVAEHDGAPLASEVVEQNWEMARATTESALGTLDPRERRILRLRFGLETGTEQTLEEISERFELTRERIRQIEAKALEKLRHPRYRATLMPFLSNRN